MDPLLSLSTFGFCVDRKGLGVFGSLAGGRSPSLFLLRLSDECCGCRKRQVPFMRQEREDGGTEGGAACLGAWKSWHQLRRLLEVGKGENAVVSGRVESSAGGASLVLSRVFSQHHFLLYFPPTISPSAIPSATGVYSPTNRFCLDFFPRLCFENLSLPVCIFPTRQIPEPPSISSCSQGRFTRISQRSMDPRCSFLHARQPSPTVNSNSSCDSR